jgi:hypothetical protein
MCENPWCEPGFLHMRLSEHAGMFRQPEARAPKASAFPRVCPRLPLVLLFPVLASLFDPDTVKQPTLVGQGLLETRFYPARLPDIRP